MCFYVAPHEMLWPSWLVGLISTTRAKGFDITANCSHVGVGLISTTRAKGFGVTANRSRVGVGSIRNEGFHTGTERPIRPFQSMHLTQQIS